MKEFYANKKVLVTGGTGLIGRQVVPMLCDMGARVVVNSLDDLEIDNRAEFVRGDLREFETCRFIIQGYDFVFHLAGIKSSPAITNTRPATMSIPALQINTNVLEACRANKVGKVLFTSSIGAYAQSDILKEEDAYKGEPMDFLPGQVKRMAEYQIQGYEKEYGLKWVIVRLTNTYGPGDNFDPDNAMFIPSLMAKIYRGDNPVIIKGDSSQIRDFTFSKDIAKGILQAMILPIIDEIWPINLGCGQGYSLKYVTQLLQEITKRKIEFDGDETSIGIKQRGLDITRAKSFGFNPTTSLYDGLKETWECFKTHPEEYKRRQNYFVD